MKQTTRWAIADALFHIMITVFIVALGVASIFGDPAPPIAIWAAPVSSLSMVYSIIVWRLNRTANRKYMSAGIFPGMAGVGMLLGLLANHLASTYFPTSPEEAFVNILFIFIIGIIAAVVILVSKTSVLTR